MDITLSAERLEVMKHIGKDLDGLIGEYLKPIEENWQPADFLPDATRENFLHEVKLLQESCRDLPYDYIAVLIGDTITEEALPTYESWLVDVIGINQVDEPESGWVKWASETVLPPHSSCTHLRVCRYRIVQAEEPGPMMPSWNRKEKHWNLLRKNTC